MNQLNISFTHLWHPSHTGSKKHLMIVLHGRGDSPEGYDWLPPALNFPDLEYLMVQAPDEYYEGYSWYDLPPNQLPGIIRSRKLLENLFQELNSMGYQPEQCILFGFSQGCLMTLEFGARFSHQLLGYIGVSGYCYDVNRLLSEACEKVIHQGKWLITHGTQDDVLNIETTRKQMEFLIQQGFQMQYIEYQKAHTIDPELELPYIRDWIQKLIK